VGSGVSSIFKGIFEYENVVVVNEISKIFFHIAASLSVFKMKDLLLFRPVQKLRF